VAKRSGEVRHMQANTADRWERLAPLSGILFSLLLASLFFLFPEEEVMNLSAEELTSLYQDRGEVNASTQYLVVGLAAIALIWFGGSLRAYLDRSEGGPGRLSGIVFGAAVAGAVLLAAANAAFLGAPATAVFSERADLLIDPVVDEIAGSIGYLTFSYGLMAIGAMFGATALAGLRTRSLPAWFSWISLLVAVALVVNVFYFLGIFVLMAWMIVAAIVLMMRLRSTAPTSP
jgi:hypothetical protein